MDWKEMLFRGKDRVWVQTFDGMLVENEGKVSMKYSPQEDAKIYHAAPSNLAPVRSAEPRNNTSTKGADFDRLIWKTPLGHIAIANERPEGLENEAVLDPEVFEFHTDGACSKNPGPCGWGWVLRHGTDYVEAHQYLGTGTNNIAEFAGILAALDYVDDENAKIRIYTDSGLAIGVFTQNWKAKENKELVEAIKKRLREFKTKPELIKIKGHAGHLLNERADFQATSSLRS